jgi:GGDEF domain-containing protein
MPDLTLPADPPTNIKTRQLHALLCAAARTVSQLCAASDECVIRLNHIEDQIEETSGIEGVRVLRFRLEECLQTLRDQTRHQREQTAELFVRLQQQIEATQAEEGEEAIFAAEIDKVSGLEEREAAERAMAAAMERGGPLYAALFVVDRLHLINAQFGYSTGDRILREFCEHLKTSLLPQDQLFRWSGPAFLAVIERGEEPAEVAADIHGMAGGQLEAAVQIGNGCVRLPIVRNALLLPLSGAGTLANVLSRMDAFTAQAARH